MEVSHGTGGPGNLMQGWIEISILNRMSIVSTFGGLVRVRVNTTNPERIIFTNGNTQSFAVHIDDLIEALMSLGEEAQ